MTKTVDIDNIAIDVCICTFRRAHVADTIRSVSRLLLRPGWKVNIIVADNDVAPSAIRTVEAVAGEIDLDVTYIHAPASNISVARNACLDAATAPLAAFVDDDELVTPGWLGAMILAMENSDADVMLGPVSAVYDSICPTWIRKGDFHSTHPVVAGGEIRTGYSGNVVMRRLSPPVAGMRFRHDLGQGGEDTAFFSSIHRTGGVIGYAPAAVITEEVPRERATLKWLLKRYFRTGQTHAILLMEETSAAFANRARNIGAAAAKSLFCLCMTLPNAIRIDRMAYWLLRGTMHAGVVSTLALRPSLANSA